MNRFQRLFSPQRRTAMIPYLVLGDPDLETSFQLMRAAVDAGADALELGIPFSDPIADGKTIQRAALRALRSGAKVDACLRLVERLRASTDVPVGLLVYYNLILRQGAAPFARRLANVGVDALVAADLPLEESGELEEQLASQRVGHVHLIAPNTPPSRAATLIERSTAFTYVVSQFGTTGAREQLEAATLDRVRTLRERTNKPLVVGFGVSRPDQFRALSECGADGVIVGSALVHRVEENLGDASALERAVRILVHSFVSERRPLTCSS